ncbi:MAG: 5'-nucleotidase C-terminal domain-containing protein [Vicinamibacterales bacterium]
MLLVDAGDLLQGTLESNMDEGRTIVDAFNALGYQAAALGNHEFDFGPEGPAATPTDGPGPAMPEGPAGIGLHPDPAAPAVVGSGFSRTNPSPAENPRGALEARLRQAHFPFLAANLIDTRTSQPVTFPNTSPSVVVEIAGVRVGLVGLITEPALTFTAAPNVAGLATTPLLPALVEQATRLRAEGATLIIAVAHAGGRCTRAGALDDLSSCEPDAEIFQLASALPKGLVDAVVAGHRHDPLAREVNGIPIIQSGWGARTFGRVDFTIDRASRQPRAHRVHQPQPICTHVTPGQDGCATADAPGSRAVEYEGAIVARGGDLATLVAPAVDAGRARRALSLESVSSVHLPHDESGQSPAGDLAADWMLALDPAADAALTNTTGFRSDIAEGPFTYGALHALIPFDNQRVAIALTGAQLARVIEGNLTRSGSMVVLGGVRAAASCIGGAVRVSLHRLSGAPVADHERLRVVTTDFLSTGGDAFLTPVMPVQVLERSSGILREEIAAWLQAHPASWGADLLNRPPRISGVPSRPMACGGK